MSALRTHAPAAQRGAALIISLILLLVMSLIGVTAMQSATMQERMAGNSRDRHLAFQAAEAALREGEAFLGSPVLPEFTNANGLYRSYAANLPVWHGTGQSPGNGIIQYSGNLGAVARAPEYFIEELRDIILPGTTTEVPPSSGSISFYRVTARGFGGTQDAIVILTTIHRRD